MSLLEASFRPLAAKELRRAALYDVRQAEGLGDTFISSVRRAVALSAQQPATGREIAPGIRKSLVGGFPDIVIHSQRLHALRLLAVSHAHRRPHYWSARR